MELTNEQIRNPTQKFDFEREDAKEIFELLKATMIQEQGLGLSANQIGRTESVFVFGDHKNPNTIEVMFNPNIVSLSLEKNTQEEGCLSFKGIYDKVERSQTIRVRFQTISGEVKTATFNGLTARIIQHEFDHLAGKIFTDTLSPLKKRRAIEKANKKFRKNYTMADLQ